MATKARPVGERNKFSAPMIVENQHAETEKVEGGAVARHAGAEQLDDLDTHAFVAVCYALPPRQDFLDNKGE